MANIQALRENLKQKGFSSSYFSTAQEAADYLDRQIDGASVGIGGSMTVKALDLYPRLSAHNRVVWHWEGGALADAMTTDVYLTSANAVAESGEIINIDGNCNRISASVFGHKKVYFIVGVNKIAPDFDKAMWRARNVAAPKRAQSMNRKTPCALKADKCYDCRSPERICRGLMVLWCKSNGIEEMEVVIVDQELGF